MKKILVVGGGPAGMTAAYQIKSRNPDYQVILLEKDSQIGKRIRISGNGRCNISNRDLTEDKYFNGDKIEEILFTFKVYGLDLFNKLHLHLYADEEGRVYPVTNSSKTVLNAFIQGLNKVNVDIHLNEEYYSYTKKNNQYLVKTDKNSYLVDKIVFATGGASYLYKAENFYNIMKSLPEDISYHALGSSLCPIKVKEKIFKAAVGKRAEVEVKIMYQDRPVFVENGEVLFKENGVSGIVIFNASSFLANKRNIKDYTLRLNFIPTLSERIIKEELKEFSPREVVNSYVVEEIGEMILSRYHNVYQGLSSFELKVKELYPLKDSQVTRGGVNLFTLNKDLSWKKDENIFFAGEMLNVDGKCGGYNISFAIGCGLLIGNNII